jgi:hypothetical protein
MQERNAGATLPRPSAALWDALLLSGGPAAALRVLDAIDNGSPWQSLATAAAWSELTEGSGIAPDVAAANVAPFGPGTGRDWESERAELVSHARRQIQTSSTTASGHPQTQPGFLADRLIRQQQRYRHLQAGGWRTLSEALPGLPAFDQWKPSQPRQRSDRPGQAIKYEAPPAFPDGGGLLLPRVPERCWRLICERQGLPLPDPATIAAGFWPWALATPALELVICEGWKKALAALSCGHAAVALPGVQMGRRVGPDGTERLIAALQALAAADRPWRIAFDAEAKPTTAGKVRGAAGALARALRAAGGRVLIARLPLLPGTGKTGLDDLLAAAGPEALDRALAEVGPVAVLPRLRRADRLAPAGRWLGEACPLPAPQAAPLLLLQAPMGCGKTEAIAAALAPLQADGVPLLPLSHRRALGRAVAERVGVLWAPRPGDDLRRLGLGCCFDSLNPASRLRISGNAWPDAVLVLDEWGQALEHLLMTHATAIGERRIATMRTLAELLAAAGQVIAADAQLSEPAVQLLERLTGRRGLLIRSEHRPMAGRPLHCPEGFTTPKASADAFRGQWEQLVAAGRPFLCWTSAQDGTVRNAPQTLAALHRDRVPGARVEVIDSTTPEAAARLAADPDSFAEGLDALYVSPAISSGVSFQRWRPAAVIACSGGRIAPEHVAQALARVRCPEVPGWLFAPERCPGAALRVGSGATDPAELIRSLQAVTDPLLGALQSAGADGAWLQAWGELGAHRNRQRHAYRATIAGLLQAEGWELQAPRPLACGARATAELGAITEAFKAAADAAVLNAPLLTPEDAATLSRRRQRTAAERAALQRFQLAERWALGDAPPTLDLLEADRDGLADRLLIGWLLRTPEALALIPHRDRQRLQEIAPDGQAFAPDRLRVTLAPRITALQALGLPALLDRLAAGEVIAATDPAVLTLHKRATEHRSQLRTATGRSPAAKPAGTLRALLEACGWELQRAGRIKARSAGERDAYTYRARPVPLPAGVDGEALAAAWLALLGTPPLGPKLPLYGISIGAKKAPAPPPPEGERIGHRLRCRMVPLQITFAPGEATASSTAPGAGLAVTFRLSTGPAAAGPPPPAADPP